MSDLAKAGKLRPPTRKQLEDSIKNLADTPEGEKALVEWTNSRSVKNMFGVLGITSLFKTGVAATQESVAAPTPGTPEALDIAANRGGMIPMPIVQNSEKSGLLPTAPMKMTMTKRSGLLR